MAQDAQVQAIAKKQVAYTLAGTDSVRVAPGLYQEGGSVPLAFDAYYPTSAAEEPLPAVILVTGFADSGARQRFGCHFKDMGVFVSWARLIAASGCVAITYVNARPDEDVAALFAHVRDNAERLHVDRQRLVIWACSGHAPNALSMVMRSTPGDGLMGATLCYPYTMDHADATHVAQASRHFGFVNACAGKTVGQLPSHVPLFIARAGRDEMPGLNVALDRFVTAAIVANLPLTLVNHATGPHAFDLFDDSAATRDVIKQTLEFITARTGAWADECDRTRRV
jgi:acetyl esterase/lipase